MSRCGLGLLHRRGRGRLARGIHRSLRVGQAWPRWLGRTSTVRSLWIRSRRVFRTETHTPIQEGAGSQCRRVPAPPTDPAPFLRLARRPLPSMSLWRARPMATGGAQYVWPPARLQRITGLGGGHSRTPLAACKREFAQTKAGGARTTPRHPCDRRGGAQRGRDRLVGRCMVVSKLTKRGSSRRGSKTRRS